VSAPGAGSAEFIGPFEYHAVTVQGRRVPHLTASFRPGGLVSLTLDDRFGVDVSVAQAQTLIPFIADCIAVGMGYSGFPRDDEGCSETTPRPPFPRMTELRERGDDD
jgi:hypothetical protein